MNYLEHYRRLMDRARDRPKPDTYLERHHVVPRCLGGGDEPGNIVALTAPEHYVAHQLLVKIHPNHVGLTYSAIRMARGCSGNKAYGWLRVRFSERIKGNQYSKGTKLSAETRAKIGARQRGRKRPEQMKRLADMNRGRKAGPMSEQRKEKIRQSKVGFVFTEEHRAKISAANTGYVHSPEARARISLGKKGKPISPEGRAAMAAAQRRRRAREKAALHPLREIDVS